MGKSRQQIDKRIKDVSKQCETMNENIGNFEGEENELVWRPLF
jgi:hypothetical protein